MQFAKLIPALYAHFMVAKAAQRQLRPNPPKTADGKVEEFFEAATVAVEGAIKDAESLKLNLTTEQRIDLLLKAETRYAGPVPFKRAEIVTPRADSGYPDKGKPHVVLEVIEGGIDQALPGGVYGLGGIFGKHFGHAPDIRVARIADDGEVEAVWRESWRFEPHPDAPQKAKDDDPDFREVGVSMPGIDPATGTAI